MPASPCHILARAARGCPEAFPVAVYFPAWDLQGFPPTSCKAVLKGKFSDVALMEKLPQLVCLKFPIKKPGVQNILEPTHHSQNS